MSHHTHHDEQMRHETGRFLAKASRLVRNPRAAYERFVRRLRVKSLPGSPAIHGTRETGESAFGNPVAVLPEPQQPTGADKTAPAMKVA